jgi:diguanylate cyclase (GGDEF)-like protein
MRSEVKTIECTYDGRILPSAAVSIGVAQSPAHGGTPEDLLKAADRALYSAKHGGRDQVSVVGTPSSKPQPAPESAGVRSG